MLMEIQDINPHKKKNGGVEFWVLYLMLICLTSTKINGTMVENFTECSALLNYDSCINMYTLVLLFTCFLTICVLR